MPQRAPPPGPDARTATTAAAGSSSSSTTRDTTPADSQPLYERKGKLFGFLHFWSSTTGEYVAGGATELPSSGAATGAGAGDGIAPPPKVFFANERTFLHWLQRRGVPVCLILGGLSVGLVNFGNASSQLAGIAFGVITVAFMVYALIRFHQRADYLQRKERGNMYEDMTGSLVLVTVVFLAVGLNFGLTFTRSPVPSTPT